MDMQKTSRQIGIFIYQIGILALILYSGYILFTKINLNYKTRLLLEQYKNEIKSIQTQNINFNNLLIYYQSKTYKELEGRKRMGLKKPGEKVIISPENKDTETIETEVKIQPKKNNQANYQKWYHLIFSREI